MYFHNDWCANSKTAQHCCPDLEALSVLCRPFYLPWELSVVIITAVYIPPDANISNALAQLQAIVYKHLRVHPDGVYIITGDFNQACFKKVSQTSSKRTEGDCTCWECSGRMRRGYWWPFTGHCREPANLLHDRVLCGLLCDKMPLLSLYSWYREIGSAHHSGD